MLSEEDDVDIHALKRQRMTISETVRRTDHDRKTIRAYLAGKRAAGVRQRAAPDPFDEFVDYFTVRPKEDPHLCAATLLDELVPRASRGRIRPLDRSRTEVCGGLHRLRARDEADQRGPSTRRAAETHFDLIELPGAPRGASSAEHICCAPSPSSGRRRPSAGFSDYIASFLLNLR
jgi:hypothetical protein